jgi:uncharacterized protein with von Willebrand factor type A (vWA) domain
MEGHPGVFFENLLLFGRMLRGLGLDVDSGRMVDLVQALEPAIIANQTDFYFVLRGLLVLRREDIPIFDRTFVQFWSSSGWISLSQPARERERSLQRLTLATPPLLPGPPGATPQDGHNPDEPPILQATFTYSPREALRKKDFAELSPEEIAEVQRFLSRLDWHPGQRRTRRYQSGVGSRVDMRHLLRRNLRYGGEVLDWLHRQPRTRPRRLVILADISGSMERYTRLLLYFAHSLNAGFAQGVETFVFSTRLTRITRQLSTRNVDRALRDIAAQVPDWSGGTRIGEALKTFNFTWGRRVLTGGAVVLLVSDGWDTGDSALLRGEIARLQRSCYRLIWLNPLLGAPDYEPLARGMQTALPFIDDFLPVHNLASLQDLAARLHQVAQSRPNRRQVTPSLTPLNQARRGESSSTPLDQVDRGDYSTTSLNKTDRGDPSFTPLNKGGRGDSSMDKPT